MPFLTGRRPIAARFLLEKVMTFLFLVLAVACALSTVLSFFALAAVGRVGLNQADGVNALVDASNVIVGRISALEERTNDALDCLLTIDSRAAYEKRIFVETNSDAGVDEVA